MGLIMGRWDVKWEGGGDKYSEKTNLFRAISLMSHKYTKSLRALSSKSCTRQFKTVLSINNSTEINSLEIKRLFCKGATV